MNVVAFFTSVGVPKTGLNAYVTIRKISDNSLTTSAAVMTEVGSGFYKYNFSTINHKEEYGIMCFCTTTLANEDRYLYAGTEGQGFTKLMTEGKWEITTSGGGLMKFYENDNSTEVASFELYDSNGVRSANPAVITRRDRV
jgi:hypothetical protein